MLSSSKKMADDYALIASAWHEAGHGICGLYQLIHIDSVSLNSDNGGETNYHIFDIDHYKDDNLKRIIFLGEIEMIYGGLESERLYYKDITGSTKFPQHLKIGASIDNAMGSEVIRKNNLAAPGKETADLKKKLKQNAEKFLREHWSSVKSIAHALYKRKYLTTDELKYILIRHPQDGAFWREKWKKIHLIHNQDENSPLSEETIKTLISPKI